jgi:hypothetical protein
MKVAQHFSAGLAFLTRPPRERIVNLHSSDCGFHIPNSAIESLLSAHRTPAIYFTDWRQSTQAPRSAL